MEGDVEGIMARPADAGPGRDKWDSWKACDGLGRTEAKRQYITTLIEALHRYASASPDARELVEELEFVWDQVKSNVSSSAGSSPAQATGIHELVSSPTYSGKDKNARVLVPESQVIEDDQDADADEFVDAPDSQYEPPSPIAEKHEEEARVSRPAEASRRTSSFAGDRWRRQVETSLIKLTAEIAALREQLEAKRLLNQKRKFSILDWIFRGLWFAIKHFAVNCVVLGIVLLWMRRKKDKRVEGAIRVLFGEAVAKAQQSASTKLPRIRDVKLKKPKP